jgi:hypothetical protein
VFTLHSLQTHLRKCSLQTTWLRQRPHDEVITGKTRTRYRTNRLSSQYRKFNSLPGTIRTQESADLNEDCAGEEARKSWDYFICDKVVYSLDPFEIALNALMGIAKDYLEGNVWIEFYMTFQLGLKAQRNDHYSGIIEAGHSKDIRRKTKIDHGAVNGNPSMFVDVAHLVENQKKMTLDGFAIPSAVRLKRFDDCRCRCGYAQGLSFQSRKITFLKDGELSILGVGTGQFGEAPHKLVKGGPQVVKDISNYKRNPVGSVRNPDTYETSFISKIIFDDKLAGCRFPEHLEFLPQSLKVLFGPGGFQIGVSQSDVVSHI